MNSFSSLLNPKNKRRFPPLVRLDFQGNNVTNSGTDTTTVTTNGNPTLSNGIITFSDNSADPTNGTKYIYFTLTVKPTYTFCIRVKFAGPFSNNYSLLSLTFNSSPMNFILYNSDSYKYMTANTVCNFSSTNGPSTTAYTHLAVVFATYNTCRTYLNGNFVEEKSNWIPAPPQNESSVRVTIGRGEKYNGEKDVNKGFTGNIDDFQLYNYPLTLTEIKYLYDNPTASL